MPDPRVYRNWLEHLLGMDSVTAARKDSVWRAARNSPTVPDQPLPNPLSPLISALDRIMPHKGPVLHSQTPDGAAGTNRPAYTPDALSTRLGQRYR